MYLDESEEGEFAEVGPVVEEGEFEESPDHAQQGEVHDVTEALAEPASGEIQPAPHSDDGGGVDEDHGRHQQGCEARRPSGGQLPVMVTQVNLQGRLEDVAGQQNDTDPPVLLLSRMLLLL